MPRLLPLLSAAALILPGCQQDGRDGTIPVGLISEDLKAPVASDVVRAATHDGLVRLDREGQVVPAAAARWAILDDGLDYIFRIDDDAGLSAAIVASKLRAALRKVAADPYFAPLDVVESVTAVTKRVVEIRLSSPQPDLLTLLAQPELAIGEAARLVANRKAAKRLELRPRSGNGQGVALKAQRAGRAIVGFAAAENLLVLGGTFVDLPVARAARLPRGALRFDPAVGLFGFAIRHSRLSPELRTALSLAIDRDRIIARIGAERQPKATTIAGSMVEPSLDQRRQTARTLLAGAPAQVSVALPHGPGANLLFASVAEDWGRIGVQAKRAPTDETADLVLVDIVAPRTTLAALACAVSAGCDPRDRLQLLNPPFIPIAAPVRWSLVSPRLDLFTGNPLAAHPLDQLRRPD